MKTLGCISLWTPLGFVNIYLQHNGLGWVHCTMTGLTVASSIGLVIDKQGWEKERGVRNTPSLPVVSQLFCHQGCPWKVRMWIIWHFGSKLLWFSFCLHVAPRANTFLKECEQLTIKSKCADETLNFTVHLCTDLAFLTNGEYSFLYFPTCPQFAFCDWFWSGFFLHLSGCVTMSTQGVQATNRQNVKELDSMKESISDIINQLQDIDPTRLSFSPFLDLDTQISLAPVSDSPESSVEELHSSSHSVSGSQHSLEPPPATNQPTSELLPLLFTVWRSKLAKAKVEFESRLDP